MVNFEILMCEHYTYNQLLCQATIFNTYPYIVDKFMIYK